jgi:hypothetical protein
VIAKLGFLGLGWGCSMRHVLPSTAGLVARLGLAALLSSQILAAKAQNAENVNGTLAPDIFSAPAAASAKASTGYSTEYSPARPYFVEFRARNAESYGHMYVMYGEVNDRHEIIKSEVAGFYPAGDAQKCLNCSVYYWTAGHILPVPSEIGASDGDLEEQYVLARFRIWVDFQQYQRLVSYINQRKAFKGPWNAFYANCVTFGRDVATFMNVKMPLIMRFAPSVVMYPKDLVEAIRDANGIHQDQGPLKDAPGALPPEVASQIGAQPAAAEVTRRHANSKKSATGPGYERTAASKTAVSTVH